MEVSALVDKFCEALDARPLPERLEMTADAIHRLQFEDRWQRLEDNQRQHMLSADGISEQAAQRIRDCPTEAAREAVIAEIARAMYFRRCAWLAYLNGHDQQPPILPQSAKKRPMFEDS